MLTLDSIVKVSITRETTSKNIRDLQTIAVISTHNVFNDAYRIYTNSEQLLADGFKEDSYAYQAVSKVFMQNPQMSKVVVANSGDQVSGKDGQSLTAVEQVRNLQSATKSWFYLLIETRDDSQKVDVAKYIETQQLVYVYSLTDVKVLDRTNTKDVASVISGLGLNKTFGMFHRDSSEICPEASWVGRFGAVSIGTGVWIHKALVGITPQNYSDTEMETLKGKGLCYYTKVGVDPTMEGNATVASGEKIFVILGCIWLEVRLGERLWNLLYVKERILYTNSGIEQVRAIIVEVLNEAVDMNILTDDDDFEIFLPDANTLTSQVRASGVLSKVTFRARLAGAILYVNKVDGTVYA